VQNAEAPSLLQSLPFSGLTPCKLAANDPAFIKLASIRIGCVLEQDDFSSNRHPALSFCLSMIFSENRFPLFRIML
jgi:hypothetical protein